MGLSMVGAEVWLELKAQDFFFFYDHKMFACVSSPK